MKNPLPSKIIFATLILLLVGAVAFVLAKYPKLEEEQKQSEQQGDVVVFSPIKNQAVSSPVKISGKAKGTWFFEASFPVSVLDQDGTVLGIAPMQAKGEWMTEDYVPFEGEVTFTQPKAMTGFLLFENDNPSDMPEFHKEYRLEINFNPLVLN